jgi:hypothetical protein
LEYLVLGILVLIILFSVKRGLGQSIHWGYILLSFTLKVAAALFFVYVYTEIYGGGELTADAGRFMAESKAIFEIHAISPSTFWSIILHLPSLAAETPELLENIPHWVADDAALLNDSQNVLRWNAVLHFISGGNIIFHAIFFAALTFAAGVDLVQFLRKQSTIPVGLLFLLCSLTPSIAFWGANMLKEPLLFIGICVLIRGLFDTLSWKRRIWRIALGLLLMIMFKPYVLVALLVGIVFYFLSQNLFPRIAPWKKMLWFSLLGIVVFMISGINRPFVQIISKQQEDFINVRDGGVYLFTPSDSIYHLYEGNIPNVEITGNTLSVNKKTTVSAFVPEKRYQINYITLHPGEEFTIKHNLGRSGSGITVLPIDNSLVNMIKMMPMNIVNVVLRPLPSDPGNWLKYLSFLENILLVSLSFLVFKFRRPNLGNDKVNLLLAMGLFMFVLIQFIGWTTPVLGAIVRYKAPALFGWVIIVAIVFDWKRFAEKIINKGNSPSKTSSKIP